MKTCLREIMRFIRDEEGATGAEHGLLITLIAIAILVGVGVLGLSVSGMYDSNAARLAGALSP